VKPIDGANMVHVLGSDRSIKTFHDYAENKVIPFIKWHLINARRVDIIWDRYLSDSLKTTTRESRGAGVRQRLLSDGKFPKNWSSYHRNAANKTELFQYLSRVIAQSAFDEGKIIITTYSMTQLCTEILVLMMTWFNQSILLLHAIMRSLIQESCCMQQMQHHKDTNVS